MISSLTRFLAPRRIGVLRLAALAGLGLLPAFDLPAHAQPEGTGRRADRQQRDGQRAGRFMRQGRGGLFNRMTEPDFLRRDMVIIADELRLDRAQGAVVETMLLDYEAAFTEASEAMRDRFRELRPETRRSPEVQEQRDRLRAELRQLRDEAVRLRETDEADGGLDPEAMEKIQSRLDQIRQQFEEMRPPRLEGDELQEMIEGMTALMSDWRRQRQDLKVGFLTDLRAILSEDQVERFWPTFERTLRRHKSLDRGQLSGEQVDLFHVLREAGLSDEETWRLDAILDEYAAALDRALVARDEYLDTDRSDLMQAFRNGNIEQAALLLSDESKLRTAVRGVNEQYAEAIAGAIGEEFNAERSEVFLDAYRQRAFPRIFRPTAMERSFSAAVGLGSLEEEALEAIVSLEAAYMSELRPINDHLVAATRSYEPRRAIDRLQRRAARREGREADDIEDPIRDAYEDRTALELRYRRQLEELLTPEQVALLPSPPREREEGDGWFGGPGRRGPRGDRWQGQREARMLERFDRDGDGQLSDEEREEAREARRGRPFGGGDDDTP
jgi:hypothetical protein